MTVTSLDDIFNAAPAEKSAEPKTVETQAAPTAVVEAPPEVPADKPAPSTGDKAGTPPDDQEPSDIQGLRAALKAERSKRQELGTKATDYEKRLAAKEAENLETAKKIAEYQALVAQYQQPKPQQQVQPVAEAPDAWIDPEGAMRFQNDQMGRQMFQLRTELSQEIFRSQRPDYDEVEKIFIEDAQQNPQLIVQLRQAPNPAKFAYEEGQRAKLRREMSDPAAYRERIRKEVEAELSQRSEPQVSKPAVTVPAPPTSLAGVPSTTPRNANRAPWTGPTPLDEILS